MAGGWRWIIRGREPRITQLATVAGVIAVIGLGFLAITWSRFVFVGFELILGLTGLALVCGVVAARRGGSLLVSIWVVFVPVGAITFFVPMVNSGLSVSTSHLVELVGATLYVGLGAAIPAGVIIYTTGVRSRTGPWESSLENHLPTSPDTISMTRVGVWLGVVVTISGALSIHLVNLGFSWFVLLLGGLTLAMFAGTRHQDSTESVVLGIVTGAGLGLVSSLGFSANISDATVLFAWMIIAGIIVGLPIGGLGYVAGRALTEDVKEVSDFSQADGLTG